MSQEVYHIPALLEQSIEGLNIKPDGIYVDVTFGGGGHSRAIMERLGPDGRLLGFDQDRDALANAIDDPRFTFVYSNFRFLLNFLHYHGIELVDGILADLGVSFHHFDAPERGFSFRHDGPLDMRMNRESPLTAARVVNEYPADRLASIFHIYGELRQARRIADALVKARTSGHPVVTTDGFLTAVSPFIDKRQEKKELAQAFQALRIEVNAEMEALKEFLEQSLLALRPGGRLAVITYHSLEDRLVKNFMRAGNFDGRQEQDFFGKSLAPMKLLTSKPITPTQQEVERNPRSRSAKLRVAQRI